MALTLLSKEKSQKEIVDLTEIKKKKNIRNKDIIKSNKFMKSRKV